MRDGEHIQWPDKLIKKTTEVLEETKQMHIEAHKQKAETTSWFYNWIEKILK